MSSRFMTLFVAACILSAAGCARQQEVVYTRIVPEGASPVYKWHGSSTGLKTYWNDTAVSLTVSAYFPETWKHAGDGFWTVEGKTGRDEPIFFIGIVRRYVNQNGTELAKIVPEVPLDRLNDWVFFVIDPNVTMEDGRITSIEPMAHLRQVLDHSITPWFNAKVLLVPEKESPLTPSPDLPPEDWPGTPVAID